MYAEEELIERLRLICGDPHVLTSPAELATYAHGSASPPLVVVVPGTVNEVAAVITACHAAGISCSPRGAAGLEVPVARVLLPVTRLRRVMRLDAAAGRITVEAGAPLISVRRALPEHLSVLPEVADASVTTVGGALARGFGRSSLTALELVTAEGLLVQLDREADGYDLAGDFVGSKGRRGVAVKAQLRVWGGYE